MGPIEGNERTSDACIARTGAPVQVVETGEEEE
jgi:hypothetical protein